MRGKPARKHTMTFDEYIGMREDQDGWSASIRIEPHHTNPTGNINGGVIISLVDNLSTGIANQCYRERFGADAFMVGVDLHAVMLANQSGGTIHATGEPVRVFPDYF